MASSRAVAIDSDIDAAELTQWTTDVLSQLRLASLAGSSGNSELKENVCCAAVESGVLCRDMPEELQSFCDNVYATPALVDELLDCLGQWVNFSGSETTFWSVLRDMLQCERAETILAGAFWHLFAPGPAKCSQTIKIKVASAYALLLCIPGSSGKSPF